MLTKVQKFTEIFSTTFVIVGGYFLDLTMDSHAAAGYQKTK